MVFKMTSLLLLCEMVVKLSASSNNISSDFYCEGNSTFNLHL